MAIWYLCRNDERADERIALARNQFRRHGHPEPYEFAAVEFRGICAAYIHQSAATFVRIGQDFIAVAGTLFYRGLAGEQALKRLLADYSAPFENWDDVLGHFAALIFKAGKLHILTDWASHFHVYQSDDRSVFSTSFLATANSLKTLTPNVQAIYEFVFTGTPLGNDTVFAEISRPRCGTEIEFGQGREPSTYTSARSLPIEQTEETLAERVERIASTLRGMFAPIVHHYGDNIQCPLSGGFDSRLVLSLLLDQGAQPHVYVYGGANDPDVRVAAEIARAEGFDLEIFEKAAFCRIVPDEFQEIVERNFHEMDATPMDGGLFDAGGNSYARHQRAKNGALAVSGGAGEIFRNYFYLSNTSMPTRAVIDAFYARLDPIECTRQFSEGEFLRNLDHKLQAALNVNSARLDRLDLERAYPMFRCPATFGREISMVGRFGPYFVPFCEYQILTQAANIPVRLRTHGVFQGALMASINKRLAGYPSVYGHSFAEQAGLKHRLSDAVSLYRPPWLRRYSYRLKNRLGPSSNPRRGFLAPDYLAEVIDLEFPQMRRFFEVANVTDTVHYATIATLEYLFEYFSGRISY